jgi:hypothetical protein
LNHLSLSPLRLQESKANEKKHIKNKVEQGIENNKNDVNIMEKTQRNRTKERE